MASAKGIKMGEGHVSVGADTDPLNKGLEDAKEMFAEWGSKIAAVGASMTAVGALIAAPFLYGLSVLNEWGDETQRVMRQTGMSFAEVDLLLDGLRGNMLEGVSGQTVVAGMATMNKFIVSAADGARNATEALGAMGLSVEGLRGMSDSERLLAFADGLERIEDSGRRSAVAMEIFGRRNVFAMNLTGGSAGIIARSARVEGLQGQSMHSTEALNASKEVIAAQNEMKLATQGFWASMGLAAAPVMRDFYQLMTKVIVAVRQWTEENRPLLTLVFYLADKLIMLGTAIGFVGTAIYAASYAFAFMQGAIAIVGGVFSFLGGIVVGVVSVAFGIMSAAMAVVSSGFGVLTVASFLWGLATSAWTGIVWVATVAYQAALMGLAVVYGVLSAVSFLWGLGTTVWTWAVVAATMAYKAVVFAAALAMGVLAAVTGTSTGVSFAYKAVMLATTLVYGAYAIMASIATLATMKYTIALIAAWFWENLVSLGINLIISALVALVMVIIGFVAIMAVATLAAFGLLAAFFSIRTSAEGATAAGTGFRNMIGSLASAISSMASGIGSAFGSALDSFLSYIGQFFTTFIDAAGTAFGHVADIAGESAAGIKAAFSGSDWALIWDILVVTAELAWIRLYPAVLAFKDGMIDLFRDAWAEFSIFAQVAWLKIKNFVYPILGRMLDVFATVAAGTPGLEEAGRRAESASRRLTGGETEVQLRERIGRERLNDWITEEQARIQRDAAIAEGDAPRAAELQERLDALNLDAWIAGEQAAIGRAIMDRQSRDAGAGDAAAVASSSAGSFSRFTAAMFEGASSQSIVESPADIMRRQQLQELEAIRRRLERQQGVVMA